MCKMSVFRVFISKIALGEVTVFVPFYRQGAKAGMATHLFTIKRQNWNLIFSLLDTYVCVYLRVCVHAHV